LNSVKELGDQGGGIRLTFTEQTNQLVIRVSDTGPGFPKNIIEQGVRPFVSYHEHGTGLGLAMVQRFVRSLAGQMTLTNDDQSHAVVTINLPRRI
jgi:nitrogen fixation/metabolism regulation signal transduction histidine kinase